METINKDILGKDFFKDLFAKKEPVALFRSLIKSKSKDVIQTVLENVDIVKYGSDLLQIACVNGNKDAIDLLIEKGADIMSPPEVVSGDDQYRKSPFIIQAAKSGDLSSVEAVLHHGGSLIDCGSICLSKKKKNVVASNLIGCVAYYGKTALLKKFIDKMGKDQMEIECLEQQDKVGVLSKSQGPFVKEFARYTPLMLAIARDDSNLDCVKLLLQKGANYGVEDEYGNTVHHIAALNGNNNILDYLAKNLKIELFARNEQGDTPLSICQKLKNQDGIKILQQYKDDYDKSKNFAESLLDELEQEDEQNEEAKAKRKLKKWRNKINKIARLENISTQEVEERLLKEEENKKKQAQQKKIEEEEKEKLAALEEERKREENRKLREELRRQEILEEQEELRKLHEKEREEALERARERELKKERYRSAARDQNKSKTRYYYQQDEHDYAEESEKPSLKKERFQSTGRQTMTQEQPERNIQAKAQSRTPRHEVDNVSRHENQSDRNKSKSVRRTQADENQTENKLTAGQDQVVKENHVIYGLGGEMELKAAQNKKAKQKIAKQLKQLEEEERLQKERMIKLAKEREEARLKHEQEEKQKMEEEKKHKAEQRRLQKEMMKKEIQVEKENDSKAFNKERNYSKPKVTDKNDNVKQKEKEKKFQKKLQEVDIKENRETKEEQKLVYRPKNIQVNPQQENPIHHENASYQDKNLKKENINKEAKKYVKKEKTENNTPLNQEKKVDAPITLKNDQPKFQNSFNQGEDTQLLQQLVIEKESEIINLQKHIDKLEKNQERLIKDCSNLQEQLKIQGNENELKSIIKSLNEKLTQQVSLNRLQALQILELEQFQQQFSS